MAKQLVRKNTLLFSTGAVTPSAVITTANNVFVNPRPKTLEYEDIGNGMAGNAKTVSLTDYTTAEFSVELIARGAGGAGNTPKYAELFKCCALKETINAGSDVTYTPNLSDITGNAHSYLDGEKRVIEGIAGNFTLNGTIGEFAKFNFSLKGFTDLEPKNEENPAVTLDSNKPLTVISASAIVVGGGSIHLESFDFDMGNEVQEIYAISKKEFYIENFKPTLKVKAVKTKGNIEHWTNFKINDLKEIVITLGNEDGNKLELKIPYANSMDPSESDDAGVIVFEQTYLCQANAGNDNFCLTYK